MRAPLAPPRLSVPRNVAAEAQAVATSCEVDSPEARIWRLSASVSAAPNDQQKVVLSSATPASSTS